MKLAEVSRNGRVVALHQSAALGYSVFYHDDMIWGSTCFIQTRQEAERAFLRTVGYPEWRKAADDALKASRDEWLASHATLASVGAKERRRYRQS